MEKLTLIVFAVILLGAALFVFTNIENITLSKKDKKENKKIDENKEIEESDKTEK